MNLAEIDPSVIGNLSHADQVKLHALLQEQVRRIKHNRLATYRPYAKQADFHALGATVRERLLMAANQVGKTWSAGFEASMHATGLYPDWWVGRRWNRPTTGWVASETMEVSRDAAQRILLGRASERGTGAIPGDLIENIAPYPNVRDAATIVKVKHVAGGTSVINFKSYDQGRAKFQGDSIDWGWPDEEPPEDIYSEMLTRTNATHGFMMMTFTPLLGMSRVVQRFTAEQSVDRSVTSMTIDDAEHYTPEQRAQIIASYPEHEREARTLGLPMLGEGAVFPVARSKVEYSASDIPNQKHWARIVGIDFGWDHPTAAAWIAWDRDADVIYVYDVYMQRKETPVFHTAAIKTRGDWIPVAWPHDGLQHDKGSGQQLAGQYRDQGLKMLWEKASFEDGGNGVEAGLMEMLDRFRTGRLKIASHLEPLWNEIRSYHRKDGRVVKEQDDIISALRYAIMMKRHAVVPSSAGQIDYASYMSSGGIA